MGKLHRVSLLLLLFACSSGEQSGPPSGQGTELKRVALKELAKPVDDRFDDKRRLKPSGRRFVWLELPMGFEEQPGSTAELAVFEARDLPFLAARDYLDEKLAAGRLELTDTAIHFWAAKPAYTGLKMEPLDVTLRKLDVSATKLRLIIRDRSPGNSQPLTVEAAREALARERQRVQ